MRLEDFILKSICITICIGTLLYFFFPRYEFISENCRCNKLNGDVEHYSDRSWDKGWHK